MTELTTLSKSTRWRRKNPEQYRMQKQAEYERREQSQTYKDNKNVAQRRRNDESREHAENARRPWFGDEDMLVMEAAMPDVEIAALLGRSTQAVSIRRHRLKQRLLLPADGEETQ